MTIKFVCEDCDAKITSHEECRIHVQSTADAGMMHIVDEHDDEDKRKRYTVSITINYEHEVLATDEKQARAKAAFYVHDKVPFYVRDRITVTGIKEIGRKN